MHSKWVYQFNGKIISVKLKNFFAMIKIRAFMDNTFGKKVSIKNVWKAGKNIYH